MEGQLIARFLVDHPFRAGTVRAILDTLTAQGGAYEPHLVRRLPDDSLRRLVPARPARLLDEVEEGGTESTFLRVAEGLVSPVLSFAVSEIPRSRPSTVTLTLPAAALAASQDIEQVLGVCKGLYLFLEAPWGTAGIAHSSPGAAPGPGGTAESSDGARRPETPEPACIRWANFFGPEIVSRLGPARLLTSMAFIVEILPDGGIMMVTHPSPDLAGRPEGCAVRWQIEDMLGVRECLSAVFGERAADRGAVSPAALRVRRKPHLPRR